VEGPAVSLIHNPNVDGSSSLSFVIPTGAQRSGGMWRDLQFRRPFLEMFFDTSRSKLQPSVLIAIVFTCLSLAANSSHL